MKKTVFGHVVDCGCITMQRNGKLVFAGTFEECVSDDVILQWALEGAWQCASDAANAQVGDGKVKRPPTENEKAARLESFLSTVLETGQRPGKEVTTKAEQVIRSAYKLAISLPEPLRSQVLTLNRAQLIGEWGVDLVEMYYGEVMS